MRQFHLGCVTCSLQNRAAQTTGQALWSNVIQTFCCPARLQSDRGANFESSLMHQLCECYGITKSRTTPYHPAGNGSVEQMNKTLLNVLRSLEAEKQCRWSEYLPELLQATQYNNNYSTQRYSICPLSQMIGWHLRQPIDMELGVGPQQHYETGKWVQDHHQKLSLPMSWLGNI